MKKVLILGVASVQMDAILTLKDLGYETYACAMAKDGPGADVADHFDKINILEIDEIIEHVKKHNIDLVYSVGSDLAMPISCKVSEMLNLPHFVSSDVARTCNNKALMREKLGDIKVGNLKFQIITDSNVEPILEFPYIMKPSDSQGQRGIVLVKSLNDFHENYEMVRKFSRSNTVIVEQYISGPELSVNAYLVDGNVVFLVASDREAWENYVGLIHKHIVPSKKLSVQTESILKEMVQESCRNIGILNGPVYFQIKIENNLPYIIEMTPRLDGCHMWKLLTYYTGVDLLKLTFEHLLENNLDMLEHYNSQPNGYELEFYCQQPNSEMKISATDLDNESLDHFLYYQKDEWVRPVNGKYDKVGYSIRKLKE